MILIPFDLIKRVKQVPNVVGLTHQVHTTEPAGARESCHPSSPPKEGRARSHLCTWAVGFGCFRCVLLVQIFSTSIHWDVLSSFLNQTNNAAMFNTFEP